MTLGLPHGQNYLVPYDPEWPLYFAQERDRLRVVLPPDAVEIQHVGSTAVSGLAAKPIIDIAIGAVSYRLADEWQQAMSSLGYDYPGDIGLPEHRIYGRDADVRRFLVHVVGWGGPQWQAYIRFRARLIADPRLAAEYEAVKTRAARQYPVGPRSQYTAAKSAFIDAVLLEGQSTDER